MTIDERIQALTLNIESLHDNIHELYETVQRNADITGKTIAELKEMNIRLANIVIRHEERLDTIDGGGEQ